MNRGIILILLGYAIWGIFPLYWSLLKHVPAIEVLAHRMLWSVPVLIIIVAFDSRWRTGFINAFKDKKEVGFLFITAVLITINWGLYIVAVNYDRVVEASMGYFLTPLLNVLAGYIVFKERINRIKQLAIALAAFGVIYYIASASIFPWIGLIVGLSFASYSVLRKMIKTTAVPGLLLETILLAPFSLGLVIYLEFTHQAIFLNQTMSTDIWLALAGVVTVVPLVLFTTGARLLPMTTTGILFYITPTLQFLIGVFVFNEAINFHQLIGFLGIWVGLILYTYSLLKESSKDQI